MRILLLNQFFHPDTAATSQLLTDLARELASAGNEVIVICGNSDYAEANSTSIPPTVKIIRSRPLPFSRSHIGRIASYAGYFITAIFQSLRIQSPDVILTLTTPPLLSLIGTLVKSTRGVTHFIWEMDLYPDVAVDLGVLRSKSIVTKLIGLLADYSRSKADGIVALGDDMRERLITRGVPQGKIHVVHNWADRLEIQEEPLPPKPLTVHYSGNLGMAHDIETIKQCMLALADNKSIRFVFAGGGPQKRPLERFCKLHNLHQSTFRSYCDRNQLSRSLAEAHLGLVTQKPETLGSIVPSKVYGIMASGRPILYVGCPNATPARIIDSFDCGWFIEAGDAEKLVRLLTWLTDKPDEIRCAGKRSRRAFVENFERQIGVSHIASLLAYKPRTASARA